jgi:addiction module HigA family antidote
MSKRTPTHPGAVLRDTVLPALEISVAQAAKHLGVTRQQLYAVLREQSAVSPEMAVRLGKLCGNGPGLWLRMQVAHDLAKAERGLGRKRIAAIPTLEATA